MKLLSCHIISFGKLSDTKFDFNDKLNVVKEDNSFGKTTLANFITSMFYGLPDLKVKDLSNDRRRYEPWQGGVYGGTLSFEYAGKKYLIERDFGKKNDAFRLIDVTAFAKREVFQINGKAVDGTNLGDVLFDINKSSFKRSAYIPQDEIICGELESGLNDKLRNLINATDENHSLDKSLGILQKAAETIETKRGKGRLKEVDDRIVELKTKIDECEICFNNAEREREEVKRLKESLKNFEAGIERYDNQIRAQNEIETISAQQRHYAAIKENIKNYEDKIRKLTGFFGGRNIESVNLDNIKEKIIAFRNQQKVYKDKDDETLTERSRLHNLDVANMAKQETKRALYAQAEGFENDKRRGIDETVKIENDKKRLVDETAKIENDKKRCIDETAKIENEIDNLKKQRRKTGGALFVILCILSFGLFYLFTKKSAKKLTGKINDLQKQFNDYRGMLDGFESRTEDIKSRTAELDGRTEEIKKQAAEFDGKIESIKKQIDQINDSDNTGMQIKLSELKAAPEKEEKLLERCKHELEKELEPFNCAATDYVERYHEIKDNYNEIVKAETALNENQAKLTEFLKDKDATKLFTKIETGFSAEELRNARSDVDRQRLRCIKEISEAESRINKNDEKADDLLDYESELSSCEESKEKLTAELEIIKKTIELLKEANDNLANQYLSPLLAKSREIIKLYDEQKSGLEFDADSKILIKEKGKDRELDYFSKGIKELISICMRISLLDIIFSDETKKPCVILDDPFVNLDDAKLEAAKEFIRKLSEKYQIIYLTCHDSRRIAI